MENHLNMELLNKIYQRLGDDISKEIFKNRLMYSITEDVKWLVESSKHYAWGREFWNTLERCANEGEIVMFGAGVGGNSLMTVTSEYPWKYVLDNNPKTEYFWEIPVVRAADFLEKYSDEYIFISARCYCDEIYEQLVQAGVPDERIINIAKTLNESYVKQYLDLEYLYAAEGKEVFVDAGCYDGMTSIRFSEWSKKDSKVYAFEPDVNNREKCQVNLEKSGIEYTIIPKGAWSEDTTLRYKGNMGGSSTVSEDGEEIIEVTTIDKVMGDENPTFIKMDIEGSEYQALIGAENTIKRCKPKLAICVYHKPEDIWELPELILKFNPEYKLYLRHYSLTDIETVLYAI